MRQHKGKGKGKGKKTGKGKYGQYQPSWARVSYVPETKCRKGIADGKLRSVDDGADGMGAGRRDWVTVVPCAEVMKIMKVESSKVRTGVASVEDEVGTCVRWW